MPYDLGSIASGLGVNDMQRNAITNALMNVQNPPPRTQMPGGGMGAPTQSPIVPSGITAGPNVPGLPGQGNAPGIPSPAQATPPPGGQPGAMGSLMNQGAPLGPPQSMPVQPGGVPLPPPGPVPGNIGVQPPQAGQVPGTQLPGQGLY